MLRSVDNIAAIPADAIILRLFGQVDKATLLQSLANNCDFPNYFGHNWDATWDCLSDCTISNVVLDVRSAQRIIIDDLVIFVSLFIDAEAKYGRPRLWCIGVDEALHDMLIK